MAGFATFSAFSSTTENGANDFSAGTVYIADNDAGVAMYDLENQKPADTVSKCIKVTYTGSLAASVKLYTTSTIGDVGQYIDLTITPGTSSDTFPDCTNFAADAGGAIYDGTLKGFSDTYNDFGTGLSTTDSNGSAWETTDSAVYQFSLTLQDDNAANGGASGPLSAGAHNFTWEAQNN
jgi:hypothetical protein